MSGDEIIDWLRDNQCKVEFHGNGEVKVSLKQSDRQWDITRESLQDAVGAIIHSGCIV